MKFFCTVVLIAIALSSCEPIRVFEQNKAIPGMAWDYGFKPDIRFQITDTTASYRIFMVLRHNDTYPFNNIWIRVTSVQPGDSAASAAQFDFPLATHEKWTGTGMDDIFEHRILLYEQPVRFRRQGEYKVVLEQVMRVNPLRGVLHAGLRVEKVD